MGMPAHAGRSHKVSPMGRRVYTLHDRVLRCGLREIAGLADAAPRARTFEFARPPRREMSDVR